MCLATCGHFDVHFQFAFGKQVPDYSLSFLEDLEVSKN